MKRVALGLFICVSIGAVSAHDEIYYHESEGDRGAVMEMPESIGPSRVEQGGVATVDGDAEALRSHYGYNHCWVQIGGVWQQIHC